MTAILKIWYSTLWDCHLKSKLNLKGENMENIIICIGDSITRGTYTAFGESAPLSVAHPNFSELLKEKLSFDRLLNYGSNGISYSSLSPVLSEDALTKKCAGFESGSIIVLAAGTNDYGTDVPLGKPTDETDISFYGAVDEVLHCLTEKNPNGTIFVVLPIPRKQSGPNKQGHTLDDYRKALSQKAAKYGLPVIDGSRLDIDPSVPEQLKKYMPDGTHPNETGHQMYAEFLYSEIEKHIKSL